MSYASDHLIPLTDEGLGNTAYLAGLAVLAGGGAQDWATATGQPLQEGS